MGYTLLYIAFGIVALWLLGEVLLQYKARLRWRALAFVGFLGVVTGVALSSVVVILLGAAGFGTGQTLVTLSYRRGETAGWALGGRPSTSRRRKGRGAFEPADQLDAESDEAGMVDPVDPSQAGNPADEDDELEVSAFGVPHFPEAGTTEGDQSRVYSPEPLQEDTGEYGYGVYARPAAYASGPYAAGGYPEYGNQGFQSQQDYGSPWQEPQQQPMAASYEQPLSQPFEQPFAQPTQAQFGDDHGYAQQQPYQGYPHYDNAQPGYEQPQYQGYEQQYPGYQQNPYGTGQEYETPPGGVWAQPQYQQPNPAHPADQAYISQQAPAQDQTWAADPYNPQPYS